jgi:hypothetical protein
MRYRTGNDPAMFFIIVPEEQGSQKYAYGLNIDNSYLHLEVSKC